MARMALKSGARSKHGISQQTFYLWKKKYAGLGLSELRELRQLREENAKLTRLLPDFLALSLKQSERDFANYGIFVDNTGIDMRMSSYFLYVSFYFFVMTNCATSSFYLRAKEIQ